MAATTQHVLLKAVIEYDGTAFAGSQVQPNARTVQGELEKALNRLIGEGTRAVSYTHLTLPTICSV